MPAVRPQVCASRYSDFADASLTAVRLESFETLKRLPRPKNCRAAASPVSVPGVEGASGLLRAHARARKRRFDGLPTPSSRTEGRGLGAGTRRRGRQRTSTRARARRKRRFDGLPTPSSRTEGRGLGAGGPGVEGASGLLRAHARARKRRFDGLPTPSSRTEGRGLGAGPGVEGASGLLRAHARARKRRFDGLPTPSSRTEGRGLGAGDRGLGPLRNSWSRASPDDRGHSPRPDVFGRWSPVAGYEHDHVMESTTAWVSTQARCRYSWIEEPEAEREALEVARRALGEPGWVLRARERYPTGRQLAACAAARRWRRSAPPGRPSARRRGCD